MSHLCRKRFSLVLIGLLASGFWSSGDQAAGQIKTSSADESLIQLGPPERLRLRVGIELDASRGALRDVRGAFPAPIECAEQQVRLVEEDVSPEVGKLIMRDVVGGEAKQGYFTIRRLNAGAKVNVIQTYEVDMHTQAPPEETSDLKIPRRVDRELKYFLGKSKNIDVNHRKIRQAVEEAVADLPEDASDWDRVEALYNYAFDKIEYEEGDNISSVEALKLGRGDCQAVSVLFVAMCRTEEVPARMVWAHEHQYAEFYLERIPTDGVEDDAKRARSEPQGQWFPVESAGTRDFGGMPTPRVILQKGDNFRVPERKGERLNYASHLLRAYPAGAGGGKPKVRYITEEM